MFDVHRKATQGVPKDYIEVQEVGVRGDLGLTLLTLGDITIEGCPGYDAPDEPHSSPWG